MRYFLLLFFLLPTLLLTAQVEVNNGSWFSRGDRVRGNGDVIEQRRDVDGFRKVKTCCSFKVEVRESNSFDVRVEAESNLQEFILTEVRGNTLHIKYTENANFKSTKEIMVYVALPRLAGIDASSSSRVTGTTPFRGDELALDVSSSATIKVEFSGDRVDLDASSSGRIEVKGSTNKVTADASSASRIDAEDLQSEEGVADVSSAANISLHTTKKLRADASSAGSIRYRGNPSDVITDTSSAGSVRSQN
jgi:hypothetical protein